MVDKLHFGGFERANGGEPMENVRNTVSSVRFLQIQPLVHLDQRLIPQEYVDFLLMCKTGTATQYLVVN